MKTILIVLTCIAQLSVPATMIYQHELTLKSGTEYRFEVRPIDPADPFRGRYVRLDFVQQQMAESQRYLPGVELFADGQHSAYAVLGVDESGLANLTSLSMIKPDTADYIKVDVSIYNQEIYSLKFPFDRYYANETKAPSMESVVRDRSRVDSLQIVTATVSIRNGRGVISQLWVGEQTIEDFLLNPE